MGDKTGHRRPTKGYLICSACGRETLAVYKRCSHCNHRRAGPLIRRLAIGAASGLLVIALIVFLLQ